MSGRQQLANIHPGEVLELEFIEPLGITRYRVAKDIGVSATRIGDICAGRRSVSADTALRLAKYFGTTARFWMGLQEDYDLEERSRHLVDELDAIEPLQRPA
ncbi:MAG: HigA family addiction module antidote protein [Deltaproteobacteria bacterium]|nr:HigA family addiction module antidote protein [Deltaproteobacteria bacterium]